MWPEKADNWSVVACQHGWGYDTSEFVDTLVTRYTVLYCTVLYCTVLVTSLDLVCDQQWWPSTSTALFYGGSLIGNILFGQIADR